MADNDPEAAEHPCPTCGLPLAEFAGPDGERGFICLTPGCDLSETDLS